MNILRVFLLALWSPLLIAQEQLEFVAPDTIPKGGIIVLDPGLSLGKPTLLMPTWLEPGAAPGPPPIFAGSSRPAVPTQFAAWSLEPKVDLTASLRLQRASDSDLRILYSVLGAVQAGGVAYLAYRHVKKYGFWK